MQSTSLCTVQHSRKHFSRACILAFVWRYQGYCFPPRGICLSGRGHFCELFSILRLLQKLCKSFYEQLRARTLRKWIFLLDISGLFIVFNPRLFVWSKSFTCSIKTQQHVTKWIARFHLWEGGHWSSCFLNLTPWEFYFLSPHWLYWFGFRECNLMHFVYQQV